MRSRMDRYNQNNSEQKSRREDKNQNLYDNLYTNSTYVEYHDDNTENALELSSINKKAKTREVYQKMKEFESIMPAPKSRRDLEQYEYLYPTDENKNYDINDILIEAKKNRVQIDELERKRKLRSTQYNILANLDLEQVEKYRQEKKQNHERQAEEEIQELINTITSNSIKDSKINDKDLMADLLPQSLDESVVKDKLTLTSPVDESKINQDTKKATSNLDNADQSFYTRSMDLSDKDFEVDSEFSDIEDKKIPVFVKIILFVLVVAVMTTIIYFVIKQI